MSNELDKTKLDIFDQVVKNLKEVYDPEISVNIYDLGLIYTINNKNNNAAPVYDVSSVTPNTGDTAKFHIREKKNPNRRYNNTRNIPTPIRPMANPTHHITNTYHDVSGLVIGSFIFSQYFIRLLHPLLMLLWLLLHYVYLDLVLWLMTA